jgi:hypothetical protein
MVSFISVSYISQVLANIMTESSHHFNILIVESPDVSDRCSVQSYEFQVPMNNFCG